MFSPSNSQFRCRIPAQPRDRGTPCRRACRWRTCDGASARRRRTSDCMRWSCRTATTSDMAANKYRASDISGSLLQSSWAFARIYLREMREEAGVVVCNAQQS